MDGLKATVRTDMIVTSLSYGRHYIGNKGDHDYFLKNRYWTVNLILYKLAHSLLLSSNPSSFVFFASLFLSFVYSESFLCFVFLDLYSDLTAKVNFGSHFGYIIEGEHLDGLYDDWTDEYDVETSLPLDDETHECVISGYCLLQGMRPHLTYSVVYSWNSSSAQDVFRSDLP